MKFPLKTEKQSLSQSSLFSFQQQGTVYSLEFTGLPEQGILISWSSLVPVTNYGGICQHLPKVLTLLNNTEVDSADSGHVLN